MLNRLIRIENRYSKGILRNCRIKSRIRNIRMWVVLLAELPMGLHTSCQNFENEQSVTNEFGGSRDSSSVSSRWSSLLLASFIATYRRNLIKEINEFGYNGTYSVSRQVFEGMCRLFEHIILFRSIREGFIAKGQLPLVVCFKRKL
jgi:hypothetical protein